MAHHAPFKALGPLDWSDVAQDDLKPLLNDTFAQAQTVIESIPSPTAPTPSLAPTGRARAQTESAVHATDVSYPGLLRQDPAALQNVQQLRKEWKEVKISPKENPHSMTVYKLSAKDGRGAWFARRSIHEGLSFDKWKAGLETEFAESMKVQGSPGSGNIRGIGADKRVEDRDVEGAGRLEVYQLSAQFPGPTAPRDFITLFLTSDFSHDQSSDPKLLREYMIVSKPCDHPECPPRDGIIRGQYESVEIIRELPSETPLPRRSMTSGDLAGETSRGASASASDLHSPTRIEWLMVTRSDPGGSVPRFMIERGTPPGIVGDAGKFLKWVDSRTTHRTHDGVAGQPQEATAEKAAATADLAPRDQPAAPQLHPDGRTTLVLDSVDENVVAPTNSSGLYGMITGALGVASSVVAGGIRSFTVAPSDTSYESSETEPIRAEDDSRSETSSVHSFASALEKYLTEDGDIQVDLENDDTGASSSREGTKFASDEPHQKELKRLHERRKKLDEKVAQMQEHMSQRRAGDSEKDKAQLAKARDKHEKEIAKQEAKYRRELQKLEDKRAQEVRKAEDRRRKQEEREKKNNMAVELERTRMERDIAKKQVEILEHQVGELQAQNTMLVAKMGKMVERERSDSGSARSLMTKSSEKSTSTPVVS